VYVTSRGFRLPKTPQEMSDSVWFNLWRTGLWPYKDLQQGDILAFFLSVAEAADLF
jgi:hypothetical protein